MAKIHESFESKQQIKTASDYSFAMTFSVVFFLISAWAYFKTDWAPVTLIISALFGMVAFTKPSLLKPLNIIWTKLGLLISTVTQPVLMFIIYFGFLTPFSFLFRMFAKKDLQPRFDPEAETYWIEKKAYAEPKTSMKNQF